MSDDLRDEVAEVLARHNWTPAGPWGGCTCGVRGGPDLTRWDHLADALAPLLTRREAEARAAGWDEALQAIVWTLENGAGSTPEALSYVAKNNPHRAALAARSDQDDNEGGAA